MTRKLFLLVLVLPAFLAPISGHAAPSFTTFGSTLVISNANVVVNYNLNAGSADFYWQGLRKLTGFYSGVTLSSGYVKGTNYTAWTYAVVSSNQVMVTATGNGHPTMKQYFTLDQTNSFLVREEVDGTALSANWMGPVVVDYHRRRGHRQLQRRPRALCSVR